ncbi:hypothetical protein L195_g005587 [Trifolium pratense]|uniref:Uncharacterized protein n=3 Tax=Trifolium pratense TaxID=57577 RepID=A0ACB0I7R7_TRIPR|nr:uncharacterized protein LOC123902416 isoform X1 [Trifolium pratense]XP_045808093.1 uncharacterized protein LOC123902416 isoform X1 [Trifolium pratense]PNY09042.1 hypothetical protein L195_g005587 [Trifolium pratense]CAJ2628081.1 unnamed protein product [Trifolium pratense]
MKPKTGLELILNYSSQYHKEKLQNHESSAGANAASRANIPFSATDPLSEIVWSQDKGFSLKCVDSSYTNKNTSLFRDVEPSSMVLALLQSVTCATDKPIDDVFVKPLSVLCGKSDVSSTDTPRNPTSDTGSGDNLKKMNSAIGTPDLPNGQRENLMNHLEKNICVPANIEIEATKIFDITEKENKSSTISGQFSQRPVGNLPVKEDGSKPSTEQNPSPKKHCKEDMDIDVDNKVVEIEDDSYARIEHMIEDECSSPLGTYLISSGINHFKKMELTSEKDLLTFNCEAATSAASSRIHVSKSNKKKNKSKVNEMMLPYSKNLPLMHSQCNFLARNENEHKLLSGEDLKCENYKSTKLFLASTSRKRCKQEVIIASKKVKMQIQETSSYSKSCVKRDNSSFMNLVSNMTKGNLQSRQNEEKSSALAHENYDRFQCFDNVGTRMSRQVGEASNSSLIRQHSFLQPQIMPINFLNSHEHRRYNTLKNESSCNMEFGKEKEGTALYSPISCLNNCKVEETSEQYADNQLLIETKKLQNFCINNEASSSGVKDEKVNNDHISKHKVGHVTPFPRLKDSELMVSMFAKRLGAIKQCQQPE